MCIRPELAKWIGDMAPPDDNEVGAELVRRRGECLHEISFREFKGAQRAGAILKSGNRLPARLKQKIAEVDLAEALRIQRRRINGMELVVLGGFKGSKLLLVVVLVFV